MFFDPIFLNLMAVRERGGKQTSLFSQEGRSKAFRLLEERYKKTPLPMGEGLGRGHE